MERHFLVIFYYLGSLSFTKISSFAKEIDQVVFICQNRAMSSRGPHLEIGFEVQTASQWIGDKNRFRA